MKSIRSSFNRWAFTLVEMLLVIAIIGILASVLLPALAGAKTKAKIAYARTQMKQLEHSIIAYKADYSRFPGTIAAANGGVPDFTFGTVNTGATGPAIMNLPPAPSPYDANNSELVGIMADLLVFRDGTVTANPNHDRNPRQHDYFKFKDGPGDLSNPAPEVGKDGVFRDPWSQPYIATVDMDYDGTCKDAMYRRTMVSTGNLVGTFNPSGSNDQFVVRAEVTVWSAGPDRTYNLGLPANTNVNNDNILSWFTR